MSKSGGVHPEEESFVDDVDSTAFGGGGSRSMSETDLKDSSGIYDIPRVLMRPPQVLTVQEKLADALLVDEASSMPGLVMLQPPRVSSALSSGNLSQSPMSVGYKHSHTFSHR